MNKDHLSEKDICNRYIIPALIRAGWDVSDRSKVIEEYSFGGEIPSGVKGLMNSSKFTFHHTERITDIFNLEERVEIIDLPPKYGRNN